MSFAESIFRLITEASSNLPSDVRKMVSDTYERENAGSLSKVALSTICQNVDMAKDKTQAICQDTGMPTFLLEVPVGVDQTELEKIIRTQVERATKEGLLRPNSVDSLTGKNSGNNLGPGTPVIHFHQAHEKKDWTVQLALKGGGSENMSAQYSLPCEVPGMGRAGRDLEGVRKCILHAVFQAQGQGCSPGYIGVCIGGDRAGGFNFAKEQLFRSAFDTNAIQDLGKLEKRIVEESNRLGVGTMGFGGNVTLLGCKIGVLNRLPASFFVSIAYQCWAFRRLGVVLDAQTGNIKRWLHRDENEILRLAKETGAQLSGKEVTLNTPVTEEQIRKIKVGDVVVINGPMHTGRDELHKHLVKNASPIDLNGHVIYHCGPVMTKDKSGRWKVGAAGPTTSSREEPYQADVMKKFKIRAVVGKGGMGPKTLQGLKEVGGVYLTAIGGSAQVYAERLPKVDGVHFLEEFGVPEAMWHYQAEGFTTVCTMDSHGNSLHKDILESSKKELEKLA
ncbi:MAG: fumarate hydratase [Deltaproteobacteria bacterium]|nr:fumarate hydratase [Deltaproteobacteria bacterium]